MPAQLRPKGNSSPKAISACLATDIGLTMLICSDRFNGEGRSYYLQTGHGAAPPLTPREQQHSAIAEPVNLTNIQPRDSHTAGPVAQESSQPGVHIAEPAAPHAAAAPKVTTTREDAAPKQPSYKFSHRGKNMFKGFLSQKWRRGS
jgi:hypothetical protein